MRLTPISEVGSVDLCGTQTHPALSEVIVATLALYARNGFHPPWIGYVAIEHDNVVGSCGFAAPPCNAEAEIAYFTFPGHEGQGVAFRMATALMSTASQRAQSDGTRFIAHTLPVHSPSTSILQKLGFEPLGSIHHAEDGEVWKWRLRSNA